MKNRFYAHIAITMLYIGVVIALSMTVSASESAAFCNFFISSDLQQSNYDNELLAAGNNPAPTPNSDDKVLIRKANAGEVGRKAVCPVMKGSFTVTRNTDAAVYKGRTYFFCCPGCAPMFRKNPAKYVK